MIFGEEEDKYHLRRQKDIDDVYLKHVIKLARGSSLQRKSFPQKIEDKAS